MSSRAKTKLDSVRDGGDDWKVRITLVSGTKTCSVNLIFTFGHICTTAKSFTFQTPRRPEFRNYNPPTKVTSKNALEINSAKRLSRECMSKETEAESSPYLWFESFSNQNVMLETSSTFGVNMPCPTTFHCPHIKR